MKARIKATGEIIEVERVIDAYGDDRYIRNPEMSGSEFYRASDLDQPIPNSQNWNSSEKESAVLEGYVARDEDGFIAVYQNKPTRDEYDCRKFWHDDISESHIELPTDSFPSVTWEGEPKKVKIEITPIEE